MAINWSMENQIELRLFGRMKSERKTMRGCDVLCRRRINRHDQKKNKAAGRRGWRQARGVIDGDAGSNDCAVRTFRKTKTERCEGITFCRSTRSLDCCCWVWPSDGVSTSALIRQWRHASSGFRVSVSFF